MTPYRCGCVGCQSFDPVELEFSASGTTPATSWTASVVVDSSDVNINALNSGNKWGGPVGSGTSLSFSFPWLNGANAWFSGYNGQPYSRDGEWTASYRSGLNVIQQQAATQALEAWSNVANITFARVQDTESTVGDIRFAFSSAEGLSNWWGWAGYPNSYWPNAGDVWINYEYAKDTDWSTGSANFKSLLHEIGHSLGLKHPFEDNPVIPAQYDSLLFTVMSYTAAPKNLWVTVTNSGSSYRWVPKEVTPETPMVLDIAAIQYMYGKNSSYRLGNDIYSLGADSPFLKTIWDAGGIDTIDASAFIQSCSINLNPGSYSSLGFRSNWFDFKTLNWSSTPDEKNIYDGSNNLGIAYDCIIENATGGSGSDRIIGNLVNNTLSGGAGDDTIEGGAGNDVLEGGDGKDTLYGGEGNDTFDWEARSRAAMDSFYGGPGNDVYVLTEGDRVFEYSGEGEDTVWVDFSYTIPIESHIENLYGYGTSKLTLTGSSGNERLQGSSNNDLIDGGAGTDTAVYALARSNYIVTKTITGYRVASSSETDELSNVEFVEFQGVSYPVLSFTDPTPPTIAISSSTTSLPAGQTALITFTLSEPSTDFTLSDVTVTGGILSSFAGSGTNYTAIFTPSANYEVNGAVSVASDRFSDAVGNLNKDGAEANNTVTITVDTKPISIFGIGNNSAGKNESVVGSAQIDKFVYAASASSYQVNYSSGRVTVKNSSSGEEDSLTNIERVKFTDKSMAFDIAGNAGKAYRVYKAAFARDPQSGDMSGLGFWISRIDNGMDMVEVAARFIDSPEFRGLYGQNPSNAEFVMKVYSNVLGRTPDQNGYDWWLSQLNTQQKTRPKVLADFAESGENQTGVASLIGNGIQYTEFVI